MRQIVLSLWCDFDFRGRHHAFCNSSPARSCHHQARGSALIPTHSTGVVQDLIEVIIEHLVCLESHPNVRVIVRQMHVSLTGLSGQRSALANRAALMRRRHSATDV